MASARLLAAGAAGVSLALAAGLAAKAHHGWSAYTDVDVTITGELVELRLGNPHDRLFLDVDGEVWDVWLAPPARNRQNGFDRDTAQIGDTIEVFGDRDPTKLEIKGEKISVNGEDILIYPERVPASMR